MNGISYWKYIFTTWILVVSIDCCAKQNTIVIKVADKSRSAIKLSFSQQKIFETEVIPTKVFSKVHILTDSTYNVVIEGVNAKALAWMNMGHYVIITPNDKLNATVEQVGDTERFKVVFSGKNADNYNWGATQIDPNQDIIFIKKILNLDTERDILSLVNDNYKLKIDKINKYADQYGNTFLKDFLIENEKSSRYYFLNAGIQAIKEKNKDYIVGESIKDALFSEMVGNNNRLLMNSRPYTLSYIYSIRLLDLCEPSDVTSTLIRKTNLINKHFTGVLREYLLSNLFYYELRKPELQPNEANRRLVSDWYAKFANTIKDLDYRYFVDNGMIGYMKGNSPFPEHILNEKVFSYDNKQSTLKELLGKYKGKVVLIDNWANWCGPCKIEMRESKENTVKLEKLGVQFIYLSLDKEIDHDKMKHVADEFDIKLDTYRINKDFKSEYAKYADIKTIPRYILLDKNGNIKSFYALRPSDRSLNSYIINNLLL